MRRLLASAMVVIACTSTEARRTGEYDAPVPPNEPGSLIATPDIPAHEIARASYWQWDGKGATTRRQRS